MKSKKTKKCLFCWEKEMNRCVHCNAKLYKFNEEQLLEIVSDFTTMEKRYCCKKCFKEYYDLKRNRVNNV